MARATSRWSNRYGPVCQVESVCNIAANRFVLRWYRMKLIKVHCSRRPYPRTLQTDSPMTSVSASGKRKGGTMTLSQYNASYLTSMPRSALLYTILSNHKAQRLFCAHMHGSPTP